ncbi:MAG: DUF429 domain-containing protein [Actinobacteria bacterium]|nr:DUF429 domain-containing protein [Actinomycetota bacterium]
MRTAGVDLASKDVNTALCVIDWEAKRVEMLRRNVSDDAIVDAVATVERTGIDAPFGWPTAFLQAINGWMDGGAWSQDQSHADALAGLRYRTTDLIVKKVRNPLSVSTDLISITAFRCARLLTMIDASVGGVDRTGCSGPVCEVYPAAALQRWGLRSRGYKSGANALEVRAEVADGLASRLAGMRLDPDQMAALRASDHVLDAFVAALVAACVVRGLSSAPDHEHRAAARTEGWIHIPQAGALAILA